MSIVNEKHKHIFIHNPKVAGSWMEKKEFIGGASHQTLYGYASEGINVEKYFKWMFVRNPYDRLVSSFFYSKRTIGRPNVSMRNHFWMLETFEKYIQNLDELFDFKKQNLDLNKRDFVNIHMVPQHYFACINGEIRLDFIGKLETINKDWEYVCQKLKQNASIEKNNQSQRQGHWIDFYTPELFQIVNEKYSKDFELFNYPKYTMTR